MAKEKTVNKSQMIREMLTKDPSLSVPEVLEALSKQGHKVTSNLVYFIKAKMKAKKRRKARRKAAAVVTNGHVDPVTLVRKVKALAGEVGGLSKLKAMVEALQE